MCEILKRIPFDINEETANKIKTLVFEPLGKVRKDLSGKLFNKLYVLGRAPSEIDKKGRTIVRWWCICSCDKHTILSVRGTNLSSGNSKSCGCYNNEIRLKNIKLAQQKIKKNLLGQTIGNFTVLEELKEKKYGSTVWRCRCNLCKNEKYIVTTNTLLNHTSYSCGCVHESIGSIKIKNILLQNNINFKQEYTFNDCINPETSFCLKFDFYLPEQNILLEYDGEQHFKELDRKFFKDSLKQRKFRDNIKNQWSILNNIKLFRIPYFEIDNIKTIHDIFNDKFLIKS